MYPSFQAAQAESTWASILQSSVLVTPGGPEKLPVIAAVRSGFDEVARVM
jgi:hypothetical protein